MVILQNLHTHYHIYVTIVIHKSQHKYTVHMHEYATILKETTDVGQVTSRLTKYAQHADQAFFKSYHIITSAKDI
jgi:hypothetical protein